LRSFSLIRTISNDEEAYSFFSENMNQFVKFDRLFMAPSKPAPEEDGISRNEKLERKEIDWNIRAKTGVSFNEFYENFRKIYDYKH